MFFVKDKLYEQLEDEPQYLGNQVVILRDEDEEWHLIGWNDRENNPIGMKMHFTKIKKSNEQKTN